MSETSKMSLEWIDKVERQNPSIKMESGIIRLPLARLSFPYLFKPQAAMEDGGSPKFAATFLFPFLADLKLLKEEANAVAKERWPTPPGPLHNPIRDQGDKSAFEGYEAGSFFITCTSERKPPICDVRSVPISDEAEIYPGCWVFGLVRCFAFEAKNRAGGVLKRGVSFGLQGVIKVADDHAFGGGSVDMGAVTAGLKGVDISSEANPEGYF